MPYQRWLTPVLLFLLSPYLLAQFGGSSLSTGNVHVHVVFDNGRHAGSNLLVRLMAGSSGTPIATSYTNEGGQTQFLGVIVGNYHILVSGEGIQTADSGVFEVDSRRTTQTQYITIHSVEASETKSTGSQAPMVSAANLNVPEKARKELDKANQAMARQDWKQALERLNKAIAIYPQYAAAYNNLGVLYGRTSDYVHEQEALEKAIALDDHFASAFANLGKLCVRQKNFPRAETLLEKAASLDPGNAESLTLLAEAQYMDEHYAAAIASAHQAHAASPAHSSFAHYIAARAYQRQNRQQDALAEFQIFLKEEPNGPRADYVRNDIAKMQSSPQ